MQETINMLLKRVKGEGKNTMHQGVTVLLGERRIFCFTDASQGSPNVSSINLPMVLCSAFSSRTMAMSGEEVSGGARF